MKTLHVAAIVAAAALAALGSAQGRPPMGGPPGGMGRPPMGGPGMGRGRDPKETADRQTQMMTQMLGLSAAQQAKVHAIILHSSMEARRIRDAQMASLKKVLTPAQMAKMDSMRGGGMGRGMAGPGGPGGMRRGGR